MTKTVKATRDKILAEMIDQPGIKTLASGLITLSDKDNAESGIRPRWFKVYSVGPGVDWIDEGAFVLVGHGRWSNAMKIDESLKLHLLDNKDLLLVSDVDPIEEGKIEIMPKAIPKRASNDTSRGL